VVSQKVADRPGGYTRILKTENRLGDNAQMCIIELVDFNELYVTDKSAVKGAKRTRRAGTRKTGVAETVAAAPVAATVKEEAAPVAEEVAPVAEEVAVDETPVAEASADEQPEAPEAEEEENKEA
jgi:large subunit ribosomal protein L17